MPSLNVLIILTELPKHLEEPEYVFDINVAQNTTITDSSSIAVQVKCPPWLWDREILVSRQQNFSLNGHQIIDVIFSPSALKRALQSVGGGLAAVSIFMNKFMQK